MLLVIVVIVGMINIVFLVPTFSEITVHENHFFFQGAAHMDTAGTTPILHRRNGTAGLVEERDDDRQHVRDLLITEAGLNITTEMEQQLPTWTQIRHVVGDAPIVLGLESCARFRTTAPPLERMVGASGMFNTGTNLLTHLLKQNCEIPERREHAGPHQSKESYGMRWQVPWGKHTPVKFRNEHSTKQATAINKDYILPVVTIRHPYSWFGSMCKNGYTAKWEHRKIKYHPDSSSPVHHNDCPKLTQHGPSSSSQNPPWNPVTVTYAEQRTDHHLSLAHLWNDWYAYYLKGGIKGIGGDDIPFVVVRMEDLVFFSKETTTLVCECAGGKIRNDQPFQHITDSAKKDSPGHDKSTGLFEAWSVNAKPNLKERYGFEEHDYDAARVALDEGLMERLGYHHPS